MRGPEALIAPIRAGGLDDADQLRRRSLRRRRENHRQRDEQRELNHDLGTSNSGTRIRRNLASTVRGRREGGYTDTGDSSVEPGDDRRRLGAGPLSDPSPWGATTPSHRSRAMSGKLW